MSATRRRFRASTRLRQPARDRAEREVFRHLERRWADRLRGERIPKAMRARIRRDPAFQSLVAMRMRGEPLAEDDRMVTPDVEQAPNGTVRSRMAEELGGDPAVYRCRECGEEMDEPGGGPCEPCRNFRRRSVSEDET